VDELPEVYNIESIEQLRALADELRMRIVELLAQQAMTVTQLGEVLGVAPAKVHYHVRELERVGLLRLSFTREKSGILEKYYVAVAKSLVVPPSLLQSAAPDELIAATNEYAQTAIAGFLRASRALTHVPPEGLREQRFMLSLGGSSLWVTPEEFREFGKALQALLDRHGQRRGVEGEREVVFFELAYDARLASEPPEPAMPHGAHPGHPGQPPQPSPPSPPQAIRPPQAPRPPAPPAPLMHSVTLERSGRVMAAGAVTFSRKDLEKVVARGERLDINVLGYCSFDGDISAELADRAIGRFRYRGLVSASPEVREVLKRKEQ
jgi:DNA-binding transcriptional ArsR family regulator